MDIKGLVLWT